MSPEHRMRRRPRGARCGAHLLPRQIAHPSRHSRRTGMIPVPARHRGPGSDAEIAEVGSRGRHRWAPSSRPGMGVPGGRQVVSHDSGCVHGNLHRPRRYQHGLLRACYPAAILSLRTCPRLTALLPAQTHRRKDPRPGRAGPRPSQAQRPLDHDRRPHLLRTCWSRWCPDANVRLRRLLGRSSPSLSAT